ncbi:unnamed protein product, partial [Symbiodinium sp. CCMP2456]
MPGPYPDSIWLLTAQAPTRFHTDRRSRSPLWRSVATALQAPTANFSFLPAAPAIRDHAQQGMSTTQVFIAAHHEQVPYILDLRRVLLDIVWATAPRGLVEVQPICARQQRRCPPGFSIRLFGGAAAVGGANHSRQVLATVFHLGQMTKATTTARMKKAVSGMPGQLDVVAPKADLPDARFAPDTSSPGPQVVGVPAPRQPVVLESLLPVSEFQASCLSLQALFSFPDKDAEDWLDNDMSLLTEDSHVPLEWRTKFVNVCKWHDYGEPQPWAIHVFTDGSASSGRHDISPCSWAFSVWFDTEWGRLLYGFASETSAICDSPFFLGECEETALVGEQLALAWGLAWTIEFAPRFQVEVFFHYDAQSAGKGAFGEWGPPCRAAIVTGMPDIATVLVHLRHIAAQLCPLWHDYVAAHAGHIENELSDQLAKQARRGPRNYYDRVAPTWPAQLAKHRLLPWAWMLFDSYFDLPTLFAMESEAGRLQQTDDRPSQAPSPGVVSKESGSCTVVMDFKAVSYNVLTLRDSKTHGDGPLPAAGMRITGKKELLK